MRAGNVVRVRGRYLVRVQGSKGSVEINVLARGIIEAADLAKQAICDDGRLFDSCGAPSEVLLVTKQGEVYYDPLSQ